MNDPNLQFTLSVLIAYRRSFVSKISQLTIFSWKRFGFFNYCFFQERFLMIMPSLTYATISIISISEILLNILFVLSYKISN